MVTCSTSFSLPSNQQRSGQVWDELRMWSVHCCSSGDQKQTQDFLLTTFQKLHPHHHTMPEPAEETTNDLARGISWYIKDPAAFTNQLSEKSSPGSPAPSQGKYLSGGPTNKGQGREPCPKPHNDSLGKPGMQPPDHNCLMATTTELLLSVQEKAPLIPQLGFLYMLLLRT